MPLRRAPMAAGGRTASGSLFARTAHPAGGWRAAAAVAHQAGGHSQRGRAVRRAEESGRRRQRPHRHQDRAERVWWTPPTRTAAEPAIVIVVPTHDRRQPLLINPRRRQATAPAQARPRRPPRPAASAEKQQKIGSLSTLGGEAAAKPRPDCPGMKAHSRPEYGYLVNVTLPCTSQVFLASAARTCLATR